MSKMYTELSNYELDTLIESLELEVKHIAEDKLSLDMARGKPHPDQVALSYGLLDEVKSTTPLMQDGVDLANYGKPFGIEGIKQLGQWLLDVSTQNIIASGTSSLNLMHDCLERGFVRGYNGCEPQCMTNMRAFLCPVPGYDRHFALTDHFGYINLPIPMREDGPDMNIVEYFVEKDKNIKGIWCVPRFSNPDGCVYSDEVVRRLAALKPKAKDFKIYWDNAYAVHTLTDDAPQVLNIFEEAKKHGNEEMIIAFSSTSKITIPGAGVGFVAAFGSTLDAIKEQLSIERVCPDKLNQFAHQKFLPTKEALLLHMKKQAEILKPKFDLVENVLSQALEGCPAKWTHPKGGYFVSFDAYAGCAKSIVELAKELGVTLTGAGATWPYGKDSQDSNIRIAPTFPTCKELKEALSVFTVCVKLVTAKKIRSER